MGRPRRRCKMLRRLHFEVRYFFGPPWDTGVSPPELLAYIREHEPGRALDLGCGTGTNILTLVRSGWTVTGVDFSRRAVQMARGKLRAADCQADLRVADVTRPLPLSAPFDLALDLGCFHAVYDVDSYLRNLAGLLRPGAHWLIYGFVRSENSAFGIGPSHLQSAERHGLRLERRTDGLDRRGRASAWFLWERSSGT